MKNILPKVTIIMPAYNSQSTILESIHSVLAQDFSFWELIVIDDLSTDNTVELVESISDSRIKLISNAYAKGAGGARRTGIEYSQSKYVAFLDSDDLWSSDKLSVQISFMEKYGRRFVYSDYEVFEDRKENNLWTHRTPEKVNYANMLKYCDIGCLTVIFDRSLMNGEKYPEIAKEDYAFWLILLKKVKFAYRTPGILSFYRKSKGSISSTKYKEVHRQWIVLRQQERLSLIKATYCLIQYMINGIHKHYLS